MYRYTYIHMCLYTYTIYKYVQLYDLVKTLHNPSIRIQYMRIDGNQFGLWFGQHGNPGNPADSPNAGSPESHESLIQLGGSRLQLNAVSWPHPLHNHGVVFLNLCWQSKRNLLSGNQTWQWILVPIYR